MKLALLFIKAELKTELLIKSPGAFIYCFRILQKVCMFIDMGNYFLSPSWCNSQKLSRNPAELLKYFRDSHGPRCSLFPGTSGRVWKWSNLQLFPARHVLLEVETHRGIPFPDRPTRLTLWGPTTSLETCVRPVR